MATTITAGNATNGLKITPDNTGILELKTGTGAGTTALTLNASQNATLAGTLQVAGVTTNMYPIVSGTAVTCAGQTSIDFTGIPSWAKRITVMFNGVSTSGTSNILIQIGSGSFTTSGYVSLAQQSGSGVTSTAGFIVTQAITAANNLYGFVGINLISGTTYVESGNTGTGSGAVFNSSGGSPALSAALDRVRITTVNGTDTFDTTPSAGTINIMWE
jgi:hypothetical protein